MKIIRLSTFLDFGGLEKRLVNVSHVQDDNEWIFTCLNNTGYAADEIKKQGKRVVNLHANPSIYSIKTTYKLYKFLKKEKPNVLHTSGAEANYHGVIAGKLAGVETIIAEEIGIPNQSLKARVIFTQIYKFAKAVIGNSKPVLKVLYENNAVPHNKLYQVNNPIIFNPIEDKLFSYKPSNATHIISVSRLTAVKNIPEVIKVIAQLIQEGYNLYYHIYGEGEQRGRLEELINDYNLSDRIVLHGFEASPMNKLHAADIFILNSFTEGFSNALCEAMYAKTISISTDSGSASEMIEHGNSGFIIPVNDTDSLKNQIKTILNLDDIKRNEIRQKAHKKVLTNYSLKQHIQELYKIYQVKKG
ncbi:glycosyltransferase [Flavobacteriaceae bacterium Ap0902]|nr:glycosyltransferase [Flavobacteriaceae bacterium Ap0902]